MSKSASANGNGKTLRDEFAIAAMQALLANHELRLVFKSGDGPPQWNGYVMDRYGERRISAKDVLAKLSYEAADAMLAARETTAK